MATWKQEIPEWVNLQNIESSSPLVFEPDQTCTYTNDTYNEEEVFIRDVGHMCPWRRRIELKGKLTTMLSLQTKTS